MPKKIQRREFLKFLLASGAMVTCTSSAGTLFSGCEKTEEVRAGTLYNFLDHLDEATIETPQKDYVKASSFVINGETREVLYEHPDSRVTFKDVPIFKDAHLTFGIGINEGAWEKAGDGVLFEATLIDEDREEHSIYSRYIDPKTRPDDRQWLEEEIDLSAFEGRVVTFTFRTSSGPEQNNVSDWAGWSELKLRGQRIAKLKRNRPPNVILISIDTLRSDHLGCYGHPWSISPNIDKLAARGILFRNAISQSPWTLPSHMSILTSLYPSVHSANSKTSKLSEERICLAEVLKEEGYLTAAFVDGGWLKQRYGYNQGFDIYDDGGGRIARVSEKVMRFLEDSFQERFFLFIHAYDVHGPYEPPAPYDEMYYTETGEGPTNSMDFIRGVGYHKYQKFDSIKSMGQVRARYAGCVNYVDTVLGKIFAKLEALKSFDNTLIIFLSDHGESLFEHHVYVGHGIFLYDNEIKIPLIVKPPRNRDENRLISDQVESIDVMPTILELLGLPKGKEAQGKSLVQLMKDRKAEGKDNFAFGESSNTGFTSFARTNKWKYISKMGTDLGEVVRGLRPGKKIDLTKYICDGEQLFDLENDPLEINNVVQREKTVADALRKGLMQWKQNNKTIAEHLLSSQEGRSPDTKRPQLTEAEKEQLRALGYVE